MLLLSMAIKVSTLSSNLFLWGIAPDWNLVIVVVAMSGGVDSSVAAALLARSPHQYDLSAVYMRNWDTLDESPSAKKNNTPCSWKQDYSDVQRICALLQIPLRLVDLSKEYWTRVFEPSLSQWEKGWTPNPDVECNREVKFGALFERLGRESGLEGAWLATGHYARKDYHESKLLPRLMRHPSRKDQSYYLSSVPLSSLTRTLFPLGNSPLPEHNGKALTKKEVRGLAREWGLHTAGREESMGICFIGEKKRFGDFVCEYPPYIYFIILFAYIHFPISQLNIYFLRQAQ